MFMKASEIDRYILKLKYRPGIIIAKSARVRWYEAWLFNSLTYPIFPSKASAFISREYVYESL